MRRRQALQTAGIGVAAFAAGLGVDTFVGRATGRSSPTLDPSFAGTRDGIVHEATVLEPFSTEGPAHIRLTLRNETDEQQTVKTGVPVPLSTVVGERTEGDGRMVAWPTSGRGVSLGGQNSSGPARPYTRTNGEWRLSSGEMVNWDVAQNHDLEAGESVHGSYHVVAWTDGPYLPDGEYVFEEPDATLTVRATRDD